MAQLLPGYRDMTLLPRIGPCLPLRVSGRGRAAAPRTTVQEGVRPKRFLHRCLMCLHP